MTLVKNSFNDRKRLRPCNSPNAAVDPYTTMYASHTTYNYAVNNPVMMNDPTGGYTYSNAAADRLYKINNPDAYTQQWASDFRSYVDSHITGEYADQWKAIIGFLSLAFSEGGSSISFTTTHEGQSYAVSLLFNGEGGMQAHVGNADLGLVYSLEQGGSWGSVGSMSNAKQNLWFKDEQAKVLFDHWVEGSGTKLLFVNGDWGKYMHQSDKLSITMHDVLKKDMKTRTQSGTFYVKMHAETGYNDYETGYGLLHGTNNFSMFVKAEMSEKGVVYDVIASWSDRIDPNKKYLKDTVYSEIIKTFTNAKDYDIRITWTEKMELWK